MAPGVVYENVRSGEPATDGLFTGLKIWFSSTVPQRSRFIEDVKDNGGEVVPLEKQADICLYDHARKNPPLGMHSYRFVEYSVRNGQLEDSDDHRIGGLPNRAARPVGSVTLASKRTRKPFTEADDQILWDWVKPYEGLKATAGNVLFQQLEDVNPRHTYQSWRERWLKYVRFQTRTTTPKNGREGRRQSSAVEQPITPQTAQQRSTAARKPPRIVVEVPLTNSAAHKRGRPRKSPPQRSTGDTVQIDSHAPPKEGEKNTQPAQEKKSDHVKPVHVQSPVRSEGDSQSFSEEDRHSLLWAADVILAVPDEDADRAWESFALAYQSHTAQQWRSFFHEVIVPYHRSWQWKPKHDKDVTGEMGEEQGEETGHSPEVAAGRLQERDEAESPKDSGSDWASTTRKDLDADQGRIQHRRSPSFQPRPHASDKSETAAQRLGLNQPLQRSTAQNNSQESAQQHRLEGIVDPAQRLSRLIWIERQPAAKVDQADSRATKRQKLARTEELVLEIPPTPENTQEIEHDEKLPETPTPRARPLPDFTLDTFATCDSTEGESNRSTPDQASEKEKLDQVRTSPLSIHLVSDHDPPITSSPSAPQENTGSPTPDFETAPEFSHIHSAASEREEEDGGEEDEEEEKEDDEEDEFETATILHKPHQQQETKQNPSTQEIYALFADPSLNQVGGLLNPDLALDLPEPEGGWDAINLIRVDSPPSNPAQFSPAQDVSPSSARPPSRPHSPAPSTTSTLDLTLDAWLELRTAQGCDADLLLTAAQATNMHKSLADVAYESLATGRGVPGEKRGIWTKEDDKLLMGMDTRGVQAVEEKHGPKGVEERWECLEVWGG